MLFTSTNYKIFLPFLDVLSICQLLQYLLVSIFFSEGALSIEVWGHRCAGFTKSKEGWEVEQQQLAKARSLADRWVTWKCVGCHNQTLTFLK
jgi:hypothetical protein